MLPLPRRHAGARACRRGREDYEELVAHDDGRGGANLVYFVTLLVCGVNVANGDLPGWLPSIGREREAAHGIEAAREIAAGSSLGNVSGLLWTETLIGAVHATAAYVLFRVFEAEGRRRASPETY